MYSIKIENKYGEQLELTNNKNYVVKATGLSPAPSNIITSSVANYGGARFVTSRKQTRNIVLSIYVNHPVEKNRINLYKFIHSDDFIRVYYKNNTRDVYIDGYVESLDVDLFEQKQIAQASIICPQPNFIDVKETTLANSTVIGGFCFPFYTQVSNPNRVDLLSADVGLVTTVFTDSSGENIYVGNYDEVYCD